MHAAKLCGAERLAAAARDLDAIEHVGERDGAAVGHVGVPVLPGVGEADRLAVLDDVGEDHDLRDAGLLERVGDVDLELAELRAEVAQLRSRKLLPRELQYSILAKRIFN